MRCKKHATDVSSSVGVCASCLRERLFALLAAQAQAQRAQEDHRRVSDTNPPALVFPRSVSPYISRRKSDTAAAEDDVTATWHHHHHHHRRTNLGLPDAKFFSTPLVGPAGGVLDCKKKKFKSFSLLSNLFRSKSEDPDSDPGNPGPTRVVDSRDSSSSSPSWFSAILHGRRQKQTRTFLPDESTTTGQRRDLGKKDRGMSPALDSDDDGGRENNEQCDAGSSGYSSESSQVWKQTPRRTPATAARAGARQSHSRNVSGIAFCLSPLVRASPSWHWNQKGVPPEVVVSGGDVRLPARPRLPAASFICKNRSRKLADFGRFNHNR